MAPSGAAAFATVQDRTVVYNEVTVSGQGAGITLEFAGGDRLTLELREGSVRIDGEEVGRYTPGDALDRSWRALLGEAIATDNGGVARLLSAWTAPTGLSGDAARGAETLSGRIASALRPTAPGGEASATDRIARELDPAAQASLLDLIVRRPERARELALLLEGRDTGALTVYVARSLEIGADEEIEGGLLVVEGDLRLDGRVEGDVLVLGGAVRLGDAARVGGDLRWIDGMLAGERGGVSGSIDELRLPEAPAVPSADEIRAEVERSIRAAQPSPRTTRSRPGFFRNAWSAVSGVIQTIFTGALLLGIGAGILYFFPRHFEVVARTVGTVPGRAFATGWATLVLSPFVWIAGVVLLAASIIGIPALIVWIPFFWLALAGSAVFGFLAVSRNLGSWWVKRRDAFHPHGLDTDQPLARLGIGIALLLAAFAGASVLEIGGGLFGVFRILLTVAGAVVLLNVAVVGLGGVVLSRAGRDGRWAGRVSDLGDISSFDDPTDFARDPFDPPANPAGTEP